MDPAAYCAQRIEDLRQDPAGRIGGRQGWQTVIVLSYLRRQQIREQEFGAALRRLAEQAQTDGSRNVASAASAILRDWEARSGTG